ncbi:MAG: endolytic transglycosylase MltG [Gemmatimonadetes bacterium]|nr:endolytic transglycosylase MltG [Gemmatimonadota bacterium]
MRVALLLAAVACGDAVDRAPRRIIIPQGASFRAAAESISAAGVVSFPAGFRLYARFVARSDRGIKAGTYMLAPGASWNEILDDLVKGKGLVHTVTVPEGLPLREALPLMARELRVNADSLAAAVADSSFRRRLDVPTPTIEGYLFPATYTYPDGTGAFDIVADMVRTFEKAWTPALDSAADAMHWSRHDVVTLASIIEKEAVKDEERAIISAVYHNRLRKGMPLQADPTVQYALGRKPGRVLFRDLRVRSPYNTYRVKGLPPGPIAAPGAKSLEAAVHPAKVPFLYFVAHPDGHHEFRTTYAEHAKAVTAMHALRDARDRDRKAARDSAAAPAAKP